MAGKILIYGLEFTLAFIFMYGIYKLVLKRTLPKILDDYEEHTEVTTEFNNKLNEIKNGKETSSSN